MEKKKLKKLSLKKDNFKLSDNEAAQVHGGGYWDPELGYVADEVTVYGDASTHWDNEGKHDVEGCGCAGNLNTSQPTPEQNIVNYWVHRLFHRGIYY